MSDTEEKITTQLAKIIQTYISDDADCEALLQVWVKMTGGLIGCILTHEGRANPQAAADDFAQIIKESIEKQCLKINKIMGH